MALPGVAAVRGRGVDLGGVETGQGGSGGGARLVARPVGPGERRGVGDVVVVARLGVVHAGVDGDGGEAGDDEDEQGHDGEHLPVFAPPPHPAPSRDVPRSFLAVAAVTCPPALVGRIPDLGTVCHHGASLSGLLSLDYGGPAPGCPDSDAAAFLDATTPAITCTRSPVRQGGPRGGVACGTTPTGCSSARGAPTGRRRPRAPTLVRRLSGS